MQETVEKTVGSFHAAADAMLANAVSSRQLREAHIESCELHTMAFRTLLGRGATPPAAAPVAPVAQVSEPTTPAPKPGETEPATPSVLEGLDDEIEQRRAADRVNTREDRKDEEAAFEYIADRKISRGGVARVRHLVADKLGVMLPVKATAAMRDAANGSIQIAVSHIWEAGVWKKLVTRVSHEARCTETDVERELGWQLDEAAEVIVRDATNGDGVIRANQLMMSIEEAVPILANLMKGHESLASTSREIPVQTEPVPETTPVPTRRPVTPVADREEADVEQIEPAALASPVTPASATRRGPIERRRPVRLEPVIPTTEYANVRDQVIAQVWPWGNDLEETCGDDQKRWIVQNLERRRDPVRLQNVRYQVYREAIFACFSKIGIRWRGEEWESDFKAQVNSQAEMIVNNCVVNGEFDRELSDFYFQLAIAKIEAWFDGEEFQDVIDEPESMACAAGVEPETVDAAPAVADREEAEVEPVEPTKGAANGSLYCTVAEIMAPKWDLEGCNLAPQPENQPAASALAQEPEADEGSTMDQGISPSEDETSVDGSETNVPAPGTQAAGAAASEMDQAGNTEEPQGTTEEAPETTPAATSETSKTAPAISEPPADPYATLSTDVQIYAYAIRDIGVWKGDDKRIIAAAHTMLATCLEPETAQKADLKRGFEVVLNGITGKKRLAEAAADKVLSHFEPEA